MEFCPDCGKLLIPKKKGKSKILACAKCGYETKFDAKQGYEVQDEVPHVPSELTEVVAVEGESGFSEEEIEERRERFIEGIDFIETE